MGHKVGFGPCYSANISRNADMREKEECAISRHIILDAYAEPQLVLIISIYSSEPLESFPSFPLRKRRPEL